MTSKHSYKITLSNNKTEKQAIDYLLQTDARFLLPSKEGRKQIVEALGLDKKYSRTFDLFMLPGYHNDEQGITVDHTEQLVLIELKTTQKYLPELPKGFFFGATQNEFDVADKLRERYQFCFVSLHPDSLGFVLLTGEEVEQMIRTKRTQYQINL